MRVTRVRYRHSQIFPRHRLPHPQSISTSNSISMAGAEEVEVKIKLPDSHSHQTLLSLLSPFLTTTHLQENLFFDTPSSTLASLRSALRLRFYNSNHRAILSLKSSPSISLGISRANELEIEVEPLSARACIENPDLLALIGPRPNLVIEKVKEMIGGEEEVRFVFLGGFRNVRNVFDWRGMKLEVDETLFDFGTRFEIECESDEPLKAKELIEELLQRNGIKFSNSTSSKFAVFRARDLLL